MSTILVETEEEEPFPALIQYVAKQLDDKENAVKTALADTPGNRLVSAAQTCFQDNDLNGVVNLVLPHLGLIVSTADDHALETAFIVLIQLIIRVSDSDESAAGKLSDKLMDFLSSSTQEKPLNRLSAMLELFNSWQSPQYQHTLLLRILDYATEAKMNQLAASMHNRADLWQRAWALDEGQSMELFERIARVLDMHPSPLLKKEAFSLQTRVLLACPSSDKQKISALQATACSAALAFIGNPGQFSCDVFQTAPIQALRGDKEQGEIFALLEMLLQGKLADYDSKRFAPLLAQAQTTEEELLDKMRLMALLAVCSSKEGQEVKFTAVEEALALEPGTAEGWLVQAFGKQLLDGRINQVEECISVRRCERRVFEPEDWKKLLADLELWKEGLDSIDVTMKGQNLLTPGFAVQPWLSS